METYMEEIFVQARLFDFYGEMLNEHQRAVYEDYVFNNISITEIAQERGISRQSVHDLIKRSSAKLYEYEQRLHLVEKFDRTKKLLGEINALAQEFLTQDDGDRKNEIAENIQKLTSGILDEL